MSTINAKVTISTIWREEPIGGKCEECARLPQRVWQMGYSQPHRQVSAQCTDGASRHDLKPPLPFAGFVCFCSALLPAGSIRNKTCAMAS